MRWIGVDPGLAGAVALIKDNGEIRVKKVPTITVKVANRKKKTRRDFDIEGCKELLQSYIGKKTKIFIEGVHPLLASKVANFNLGRSRGIWEGVIIGLGLKYELVSPGAWKNYYFPLKKGRRKEKHKKKEAAMKKALKLFPEAKKYLKLKKDIDKADALLLAYFGKVKYGSSKNI